MQDFFDRHGKKFIVVVGIVLMIAFLLPSVPNFGGGAGGALGTIDGKTVRHTDTQRSLNQLLLLRQMVIVPDPAEGGRQMPIPALAALFNQNDAIRQRLQDDAETWFLLARETELTGVAPPDEQVNNLLTRTAVIDGQSLIQFDGINPDRQGEFRDAMRTLMAIRINFDRNRSGILVSTPEVKHELARGYQQLSFGLVEFTGGVAPTSQPVTDDDLQQQFNKYANTAAGTFDEKTNPFGFGYQVPDRVKVQVIAVPAAELRRVAKAAKTDYQWNVVAQKYYLENQSEFTPEAPTSKPASQPTTNATSQPAASQPAASQPAVRPFAEVRDLIVNRMLDAQIATLQTAVTNRLEAALRSDFDARTRGGAKNIASYDYLKTVVADVAKQTGVQADTYSYADAFRSAEELNALPTLGRVRVFPEDPRLGGDFTGVTFGQYALSVAAPALGNDKAAADGVLLKPSRPLPAETATFIFRVVEAEAAHPAKTLADTRDKVERDVRRLRSFEAAKNAAKQQIEIAQKSGLVNAAAGRPVLRTGPVNPRPQMPIPALNGDMALSYEFAFEAFSLLYTEGAKATPVYGVIALPRANRVFLAELSDITPGWTTASDEVLFKRVVRERVAQVDRTALTEGGGSAMTEWLSREQVSARLKFVPANRDNRAPSPAPVAPPPNAPFR